MSERVELRKCERPDCTAYHSPNFQHSDEVHIANLEWRVVEAAVAWLKAGGNVYYEQDKCTETGVLANVVDALIAAREAELKEK